LAKQDVLQKRGASRGVGNRKGRNESKSPWDVHKNGRVKGEQSLPKIAK